MAPLMVGVSGLRGIVGESLTAEVAEWFARAFGGWLRERGSRGPRPKVVVGADGRAGYEAIHRAAVAGLVGEGCDVIDLGVAMTPACGVLADYHSADGGLIVTASHNPQQWNGLKCLVRDPAVVDPPAGTGKIDACAPPARMAQLIIDRFNSPAVNRKRAPDTGQVTAFHQSGRVHGNSVSHPLQEVGVSLLRPTEAFDVVLDSVNSSGGRFSQELLADFGGRVQQLHGDNSGMFPHPPEPTKEHLVGLCEAVKRSNADVGFAQDPDADRLAIVDERGTYIGEEYTFVLAAEALLGVPTGALNRVARKLGMSEKRILVTNLSTSRMIDDLAARHGARVVRTPVGEANVVEAMKREKAAGRDVVLGGEGNGGVIWPRVTYVRDSLSAMALTLALMARRNEPLSAIVASMPRYAIEKRKVDLARKEDARPAVDAVAAAYKAARLDMQDGVRVDWDDRRAWLHVRASNTEPIMRLIAEAPTEAEARAILDEAARVIAG